MGNQTYAQIRTIDDRLNAVARLHHKTVEDGLPWDCYNGNCADHCEHHEVEMEICVECTRIAQEVNDEAGMVLWPCETAKAGGWDV